MVHFPSPLPLHPHFVKSAISKYTSGGWGRCLHRLAWVHGGLFLSGGFGLGRCEMCKPVTRWWDFELLSS